VATPTGVAPITGRVTRLARIVHAMTSERGDERPSDGLAHAAPHDAAHLDEDAEALEDPVHCGDARHQHDKHQHDLHERAADQPD
jgi:hypothetical protein